MTNGQPAVPAGRPDAVLRAEHLSVEYAGRRPTRAVRDVTLELRRGEVLGIAGESGCGKSTLAYALTRMLKPPARQTSGSITFFPADGVPVDVLALQGEDLRQFRWNTIAMVFQSAMNALNPVLNVRDQMLDVIYAHLKISKRDAAEKVGSLLDLVGIPRTRLRSYPHELSGGMRQRVMIAMALATDPEVVIMDEPTTALDVVVQRDILAQIVELKERLGFSILFITHDLSLLLELADRIAVMYAGQLVEIGTAEQIHHEPSHPYTKGLLNSFPSLRGPRRELAGIPGSPPDLHRPPPGCRFLPRCPYGTQACARIDMRLSPVSTSADRGHVTACPFVLPDTPVAPRSQVLGLTSTDERGTTKVPSQEPPENPPSGYVPGDVAERVLVDGSPPDSLDGSHLAALDVEPSRGELGT
jgi:peptide/nickel transport system ATP-binding protein